MTLTPEIIVDSRVRVACAERLAALLRYAAGYVRDMPFGEWELTLRVTTDDEIAQIHHRFFGDPDPTDVITFPSGESSGYLGDVVVSGETATSQAVEAGHSPEREIAFLALHGFLHLCGRDDADTAARDAMLDEQESLLSEFEREYGACW